MADRPERYCICRKPYDSSQFMIACDSCGEWFHGSCVGIQEHQASDIERYHCPNCSSVHGPLTLKKRRNWHRHDYSEIDDGSKAVQTGTVLFINNLKNKKFASSKDILVKVQGKDLTLEYFEKNGFSKPLCIDKKDGLGLMVPPEDFSVLDVEKYIGSMKELDVIDVNKQEDIKMFMREWTEYYMNPIRKKTLNVISLEFSKTGLSSLVQIPTVVRDMDWVNHAWPSDLPEDSPHKRPFVQKYCLMSVKNCYTDFHVDFGGTSVWYHVLRGEKIFYFVEPTPANLEQYHKWVISPSQSEVFFGNMVSKCYKVVLKQGQTLFIPTGWIHGVFTPTDSLVFGGNFLHSFNIGLQLEIYDLEIKLKTPTKFQHPFYETVNWYAAIYLLDKLKGILENGSKVPQYLIKGLRVLTDKLKEWSAKGEEFMKHHKFFIPDGVQPGKLIRSLNKELKKAEKSKTSRPSTPKVDDFPRNTTKPAPSVTIDAGNKITIKNLAFDNQGSSKRTSKKDQNSNEEKGYSCQVDESKPIIRIANPGGVQGDSLDTQGDSLDTQGDSHTGYQGDSLSKSMPSLKLKIPRRQESMEKLDTNLSASADSTLKLVVSNGKIISNTRSSVENSGSSKYFQPLVGDSIDPEGQYSCTTTNKEPLKLKLSMSTSGFSAPQDNQIFPNDSDLDLSDDEFGFSFGGTPDLMNMPGRTETTQGLQSTSTETRLPQPVAHLESKDRDFKAEIEAAKTLLFGFSSLADSNIQNSLDSSPMKKTTPQISRSNQKSKLNSKRPYSESEEESSEEDLGFGDSDYFKDKKFAYPPLSEMVDEEKSSWKPGMKKKKSEKVDATWNPKSKVIRSPSKEIRPQRTSSRLSSNPEKGPSLLNAPLPTDNEKSPSLLLPITTSPTGFSSQLNSSNSQTESQTPTSSAGAVNTQRPGPSVSQAHGSHQAAPSKRGRHKAVSTTKQRLAKILKLDKTGRYKR